MNRDDRLRALPSVDRLARSVARAELSTRRQEIIGGSTAEADLVEAAGARLRPHLRRVLNATGVVVHTNLGRAPLGVEARAAVLRVAEGYSNLEFDLIDGERGSRHDHVRELLCELTGAEHAMVVNNCAAAVLLAVAALAADRETVVSRGQLIEIGGGFRIPEILAQARTRLIEVGTTNRTQLSDYEAAIGEATGAVLRVHPSNFRSVGFVEEVEIEALCSLGARVIDDIGSGFLADEVPLLADEPPVRRSVRAGAALVAFSGDKLIGGPQAGIMLGHREAIEACEQHPLARALRIDKLSLAALEATLALYRDPAAARLSIPVLRMLDTDQDSLSRRARALADETSGTLVEATARVGGGALPLLELRGPAVAVDPGRANVIEVAAALRRCEPAVLGRIQGGCLLLDPRTLTDDEVRDVATAVNVVLGREHG